MFWSKGNLGKLERLQENALSTIFLEKSLSYNELFKKSGQLSVEMNLIRFLIIEVVRGIKPSYLDDMFIAPSFNFDFRNPPRLLQPKFNTHKFGHKSFRDFGSKVWTLLQAKLKKSENIHAFIKEL